MMVKHLVALTADCCVYPQTEATPTKEKSPSIRWTCNRMNQKDGCSVLWQTELTHSSEAVAAGACPGLGCVCSAAVDDVYYLLWWGCGQGEQTLSRMWKTLACFGLVTWGVTSDSETQHKSCTHHHQRFIKVCDWFITTVLKAFFIWFCVSEYSIVKDFLLKHSSQQPVEYCQAECFLLQWFHTMLT